MKAEKGGFREGRIEQRVDARRQDSDKAKRKLADPFRCPGCGAVHKKAHWACGESPEGELCPACQRIEDRLPAGYVTLYGKHFEAHRTEILGLVRNLEAKGLAEHPLQRIVAIEEADDSAQITTTDAHLARSIAEHVHKACKGELRVHPVKNENLFRARWER